MPRISDLLFAAALCMLLPACEQSPTGGGETSTTNSTPSSAEPVPTHAVAPPPAGDASRPNVIFILADDQAPGTLSCEGNAIIKTPQIDRLAREGTYFSRAYVVLPQCAPSRAAILTGRYPHEHGPLSNTRARLPKNARTIADVLKAQGYRCGLVGKWHLENALEKQAGFDDWWVAYDKDTTPRDEKYTFPTIVVNGESHRERTWLSDAFARYAIEFIDQPDDRPFFLWLAFHAPHTPITPNPDFPYDPGQMQLPENIKDDLSTKPEVQRRSDPHRLFQGTPPQAMLKERAEYYSMISALDAAVGKLVDHLREKGLAERTLVVYASDNGWMIGEHQMCSKGPALYEELVRTPLIFWQPGTVPAGRKSDALVSTIDFFPTWAALGGDGAAAAAAPGKDLWPLVMGKVDSVQDAVFLEYEQKSGPEDFEPMLGVVTRQYKYTRYLLGGEEELYDLSADPLEMTNLVTATDRAADLAAQRKRIDDFQASIKKPFWVR